MKLLSLILIALFLSGCANWTKEQKLWEGAYLTGQFIDYLQTKEILSNPDFYEMNPLIDEDNVEVYFIGTSLLHLALSDWLPPKERLFWQKVSAITTFGVVGRNYYIGVRF